MAHSSDDLGVTKAERSILQALCQGTPQGSVREAAKRLLGDYRWREPVHQLVFEVLLNFRSHSPDLIRERLPALLTRRGFPDFAWEDFFAPHSLTREDAERLMRELLDLK